MKSPINVRNTTIHKKDNSYKLAITRTRKTRYRAKKLRENLLSSPEFKPVIPQQKLLIFNLNSKEVLGKNVSFIFLTPKIESKTLTGLVGKLSFLFLIWTCFNSFQYCCKSNEIARKLKMKLSVKFQWNSVKFDLRCRPKRPKNEAVLALKSTRDFEQISSFMGILYHLQRFLPILHFIPTSYAHLWNSTNSGEVTCNK